MVDFGAIWGFDVSRIVGAAVVIGIIIFFGWFMRRRSQYNAEYGTRYERRLEREEGLVGLTNAFRTLIGHSKQGKKDEKRK